jgi:hypothetical protein
MKGVKKIDEWTTGKREKGRVEGEGMREKERVSALAKY